MSALSKTQKFHLVQLAQRAFNLAGAKARGAGLGASGLTPGACDDLQSSLAALAANGSAACFTSWRHEHVGLAVKKAGLRLCDQLDYNPLVSYFNHLLGEDGKALNAALKANTEAVRQFAHLIQAACRRWDFHLGYAEKICRDKFQKSLDEADEPQLRQVLYTLNNRGAARKRKHESGRALAAAAP